uniref:Uncharacterized protein n=1 Tax=Anguilla anguilla TaxID=7936 RepID=A0A0E9VYE7_ANGAN
MGTDHTPSKMDKGSSH